MTAPTKLPDPPEVRVAKIWANALTSTAGGIGVVALIIVIILKAC